MFNTKGSVPLPVLFAIIGVLVFFIIASIGAFKDNLFNSIYPKKSSHAANSATPKPYTGQGGASFSLSSDASNYPQGQPIQVAIKVRTDTHKANLFSAQIIFDPTLLEVQSIDTTSTFITNWVEETYDNSSGTSSIVGGVPKPGFSTSGSDAIMATLIFRAKAAGSTTVSFAPTSAIYRNSDNVNLLVSTSNSTFTVSPLPSPSPSPTLTPSPSPTPTPTPTPSLSPSPTPTPTPTPPPAYCSLTSASWISSSNPIDEGSIVNLSVTTAGDCVSKQLIFTIWEDDQLLGSDPVSLNPGTLTLNATGTGVTSWATEYQPDGFNGLNDPPEYYFTASLMDGSSTITSQDPKLQVNKLPSTVFAQGDVNRDSSVDLQDLSVLLSYWFDTANFPDEIDINSDGIINTFDFADMLLILRSNGVIGPSQ